VLLKLIEQITGCSWVNLQFLTDRLFGTRLLSEISNQKNGLKEFIDGQIAICKDRIGSIPKRLITFGAKITLLKAVAHTTVNSYVCARAVGADTGIRPSPAVLDSSPLPSSKSTL